MKIFSLFILFTAFLFTAEAQVFYTPRDAQAIKALKDQAIKDGYTNPQISGVATAKGNYPLAFITINNKFNLGSETNSTQEEFKGTASFWGYLVRSDAKPDSLRAYIVVLVHIVGYMVFDAPAGIDLKALPGNFSLNLPTNPDDSPSWMNTDEMVNRLRTNTIYVNYRQSHQDSTPDYVALGMSKLPTPTFPAGEPLWTVTFTGENAGDFLSCSVHALNGQVECVTAPTSVQDNSFKSVFSVSPNPARSSVSVSIPSELYSHSGTIELYNVIGEKIYSFAMSGAGEGYAIVIPVENYPSGMYFIRYSNGAQISTQVLTIE